ncbi:MAG TPA: glycoside hydrolase family 130 protein [Acidimicrobiia bacterium]|jgi:predicted GH43/DUF377 family glycosyl hydrolase|nr:glycoside hydrolase family 130 protein [Acidimicrobiia bacterium]
MAAIPVTRLPVHLRPDQRRVITKPYLSMDESPVEGRTRVEGLIHRVLALDSAEVRYTLRELEKSYEERHLDLNDVFARGFSVVAPLVPDVGGLSVDMRRLIGAYFMHEYSIEGAALTNPSIVAAPDQGGVPDGSLRVIVSVRAVGEGHVSSIEFRTGLVGNNGEIDLESPGAPVTGSRRSPWFDKTVFTAKLDEIGAIDDLVRRTLNRLEERFTTADLQDALTTLDREEVPPSPAHHAIATMRWLASSNYEATFSEETDVSQRVLFPNGPAESRGMEDARFVRFVDPDGTTVYYATYTAFDGFNVLPQLIETADFLTFRIATLNGRAARNKGIAIFPRLVSGRYAALARCDGESNYFMQSDNIRFWHDAEPIQTPARPWELMQIGNSGSPIETEAGWLVMTHGVGPMRTYALGAILLDLDDPSRVIGHLKEPLLVPEMSEREGYVPNVVYSCGSLVHAGRLVVAYGASDRSTRFATVEVEALITQLTRN